MFGALGLTAVSLLYEIREGFEYTLFRLSAMENLSSKSHLRNLSVYNVTGDNKSYTVP
jgi:hypothetical protein